VSPTSTRRLDAATSRLSPASGARHRRCSPSAVAWQRLASRQLPLMALLRRPPMPPLRPLAGQGGHWRADDRTTRDFGAHDLNHPHVGAHSPPASPPSAEAWGMVETKPGPKSKRDVGKNSHNSQPDGRHRDRLGAMFGVKGRYVEQARAALPPSMSATHARQRQRTPAVWPVGNFPRHSHHRRARRLPVRVDAIVAVQSGGHVHRQRADMCRLTACPHRRRGTRSTKKQSPNFHSHRHRSSQCRAKGSSWRLRYPT
jgi:hypothetical protein